MLGRAAPSLSAIKCWVTKFRAGETDVGHRPRAGHPKTGQRDRNIRRISATIKKDKRLTIREMSTKTKLVVTNVWRIVSICLGLILKCARWISKILTKERKNFRVNASRENLDLYYQDPEHFKNQLVTGVETYMHPYEPETKRHSKQWLEPGSRPPQKAKNANTEICS